MGQSVFERARSWRQRLADQAERKRHGAAPRKITNSEMPDDSMVNSPEDSAGISTASVPGRRVVAPQKLAGILRASQPVVAIDDNDTERSPTASPAATHKARFMWLERLIAWRRARATKVDPTLPASNLTAAQSAIELPERAPDLILLGAAMALLCIGTIEIHSATAAEALNSPHATHFLQRQLMFVGLGGIAMWFGARMDYSRLQRYVYPMLAVSLMLLAVVLLFPAKNGAKRWIPIGPMTFQPVEIAKLALITYLAYSLGRKAERVKTFTVGFVPHLVVCGAMMVLLLKQPDLGSSIVLGATTLGMLFVAGARVSYIVLAMLACAPIAYNLVVGTPWRMQRFLAYFNPEAFAQKEAYQFLQARLALGSGGFFGTGLGGGHQTLGYMPESHNDFILAPIGEELGFIGVALVIVLFGILIWRGVRTALGARDVFGGYLAFGITILFAVQALFNVGVVLGIVPNKGITLPLVSYGGSSLCITMFLVGLMLNVSKRPERRGVPVRKIVNAPVFATRKRQRVQIQVA
jgi:cell division protein FtsW